MFIGNRSPPFLLQRLILSNPFKTKPIIYSSQCLLHKNIKSFFSRQEIPIPSFCSFQKNLSPSLIQADFQEDLILLMNFSREQLTYTTDLMEKYTQCKDLAPNEVMEVSSIFYKLAHAHRNQENMTKALFYLREEEDLCQKAGIKDTLNLAQSHFLHANISMDQGKWTEAEHYLNKMDRICKLLKEDKDVKYLMVQLYCSFARVSLQSDHEKALEFYKSALERIGDVKEEFLPKMLVNVYDGMGHIYSSRHDVEKTLEYWTKGLETANKYLEKNSQDALSLSKRLTTFLYDNGQYTRALPYAKNNVKMALEVFSKDSAQAASSFLTLGHLYFTHQDFLKALTSYKKALKFFEKSPQEHADALWNIYFMLIRIYASRGDSKKASNFLREADKALCLIPQKNEEILAGKYVKLGRELKELQEMAEMSQSFFWRALDIHKRLEPLNNDIINEIYGTLGEMSFEAKDWNKAFELFKECERHVNEKDFDASSTLNAYLGSVCMNMENFDEAEKYLQKVLRSSKDIEQIGIAYQDLAIINEKRGMLKEALELYQKAVEYQGQSADKNDSEIEVKLEKISEIENILRIRTE